jgi:hypothetical protein
MFQALMHGLLAGRLNQDGTACFWVGSTDDPTYLIWPDGYSAHGSPLGVFDQTGHQVATVGQPFNFGGGMFYGADLKTPLVGCGPVRRAFLVNGSQLTQVGDSGGPIESSDGHGGLLVYGTITASGGGR